MKKLKKIEAEQFREYKIPQNLKAGPGDALAFVVKQANLAGNSYNTDLWLWQKNSATRLTFSGDVLEYWWQGDTIIFSVLRNPKDKEMAEKGFPVTVLYRLSTHKPGEAEEFLRLQQTVQDIAFLPDSRFLCVAEYDPALQAILDRQPDVAGALDAIQKERECEVLTELPFWENGGGFTSGKRQRLYLYTEGTSTPLTNETTNVEQLRLSPSGNYAYFTARDFSKKAPYANRLMRFNLQSGVVEDLTFFENFIHSTFAVLEEENLLVWGSDMQQYGIHQNGSFYNVSIATRSVHPLACGSLECEDTILTDLKAGREVVWAADSPHVYCISTLAASSHVVCINTQEGSIQQHTSQPGCVTEVSLLHKSVYYIALRGLAGPELYRIGSNGEECLTSFNTWLGEEYHFSIPLECSFPNKEEHAIQGWVLKPTDFSAEATYPLVLYIHGGPKMAYGNVLFHEMQMLAAQGFGVLLCNPTGSSGRGDDFADIRGRYGLVDYEDIMGFLDATLAANPWIDEKRIAIAGGSYGGYLVNWIIGHTERFAAAISQRGISNWVSMATTSDIGYFFVPDQTATNIWEDSALLWEQSPLKYANKVQTPTLFVHSAEDYRCPFTESLQMYSALQMNNVPTRLALFRSENHDLSRTGKPANRIRRLQEITGWIKTHLG